MKNYIYPFLAVLLVLGCGKKNQKPVNTLLTQKPWILTYSKHKIENTTSWSEDNCDKSQVAITFNTYGKGSGTAGINRPDCGDISGNFTWNLASDQKTLNLTQGVTSVKYTITQIDEITLKIDFAVTIKGPSAFGKGDTLVLWEKIYNHPDFEKGALPK